MSSRLQRAIEPLDIFIARIRATLPVPHERRQNDHVAQDRRRIRGQSGGGGPLLLPRLEVKPNDPHRRTTTVGKLICSTELHCRTGQL